MGTITPAHVDEEIKKYTILLSDLRAQKNAFLSVSRLPPETLANIFIHCAAYDYWHESNSNPPNFHVLPHWVNVSYVSRRWRDVAVNCPTLWAYHFTVSHRWTEELLARSKQASLKICIRYHHARPSSWWSCLVEKVFNHAERIQELRLHVQEHLLPTELTVYAPRLEVLDIRSWSTPSLTINHGDFVPLRALRLNHCSLAWHLAFNLGGVTTLFLEEIPAASQQNLVEFLGTLSRMRVLAVLHLQRALPSAHGFFSSGVFDIAPKVTLPHLTCLFINGLLSTVTGLLSCTSFPLKTYVRLEIQSEDNSDEDYDRIPSILSRRFSQSEDLTCSPTIRSLIVRFPDVAERRFAVSASEHDDYDPRLLAPYPSLDCKVLFMIRVRMESSASNRDRLVGDICRSIPSTHTQKLHVVNPTFSHDFWEKTLEHLDGLRQMKLSDGAMPDLASLLRVTTDGLAHRTFVSALEELELRRIMFASCDDFPGVAICEESLLDALSTRKSLRLSKISCFVQLDDNDDEDESDTEVYCEEWH